jgi:hypothetical protein
MFLSKYDVPEENSCMLVPLKLLREGTLSGVWVVMEIVTGAEGLFTTVVPVVVVVAVVPAPQPVRARTRSATR